MPLNWNTTVEEQESGPRAAIAIIKLPARVPVTDSRYGGPVVLNPGGPGGSGVYQALSDAKSIQGLLDASPGSSEGKYFDILSFDPRGVNNTTPHLQCFTEPAEQQAWLGSLPDYGLLWHSDSVIGLEWARAAALGASCSHGEDETGILQHANTAQTVQDMVQIIEKAGEWREKESATVISSSRRRFGNSESRAVMSRVAYSPGQERIQYWGMSYGTLIGSTFAAMHPNRVHRLVIDGVVDPADHYAGSWLTQLQDADKILSKFCEYCFRAGPDRCPLYLSSSAEDIEARITSILTSLKENPIPMVVSSGDGRQAGPALVTYGDAHLRLLSAMYFSFATVETFFDMVLALESRNSSSPVLKSIVARKQMLWKSTGSPGDQIPYRSVFGPFQAISCMDSGISLNLTREDFEKYLVEAQSQSQWVGVSWARNKLACLGYTVEPKWRLPFTFQTQQWSNTSHPLLIVGNTHDTVTPIRNARRVSTLFPGSVVLHQDSEGHCSHSTPSLCTIKAIREYFQTGKLPQEGTICAPETRPFLGCTGRNGDGSAECDFGDGEDARLWEIAVELSDPFGIK